MGAKGATWEPRPEGPKLEPKGSQKTKNREGVKHKIAKCRKIEKSLQMKKLKSEHADISFILQHKLITF